MLQPQVLRPQKLTIPLLAVAMVLVIVALVLMVAIVPGMKKMPDDVDTTRHYEGTLNTMLNAEALASMDIANMFLRDVDIDISRHYTVEETDGNEAIVRELIYITDSKSGTTIHSTDKWYAVDRKTLESVPDFSGNDEVLERRGLVFAFPIGAEKEDYRRWISDFQTTAPVIYTGEEDRSGLDTYVYKSIVPVGEITDADLLATLPTAIPKSTFTLLTSMIQLPDAQSAALEAIVPTLPDPVPLKYTFEYGATYWIEPETGINVDVEKYEIRKAALEVQGQLIPLLTVFDVEYETTATSIDEAIDEADDMKDLIDFWENTLPNAFIAIGAVLVLFVLFIAFLQRRRESQSA